MGEGRLTADTLVWREGWQDWRRAGEVFPQLSSRLSIPETEDLDSEADDSAVIAHAAPVHDERPRPRTVAAGVMVLIGLVLSLALLAVLIKIF